MFKKYIHFNHKMDILHYKLFYSLILIYHTMNISQIPSRIFSGYLSDLGKQYPYPSWSHSLVELTEVP